MIDAGSTGSRIHIYRWHPRVRTLHAEPEIETPAPRRPFSRPVSQSDWSLKVMPGLNAFTRRPERAAESLMPLLAFAVGVFTKLNATDKIPRSPVFLKATGGVRALPEKDRTAILNRVRIYLMSTGFLFQPEYVQVISGEEEGVFGWLTVNYLVSKRTLFWNETTERSAHTVGALDLGGASMQATFRPFKGQSLLSNQYPLALSYTRNSLYTECFWYYGKDSALWRVHNVLLVVSHPYLFHGNPLSHIPSGWSLPVDSTADDDHDSEHPGHPQDSNKMKKDKKERRKSINTVNLNNNNDNSASKDKTDRVWNDSTTTKDVTLIKKRPLREKNNNKGSQSGNKKSNKRIGGRGVSNRGEDAVFTSPCLPTGYEARFVGAGGIGSIVMGQSNYTECYTLAKHVIETRTTGPCLTHATTLTPLPGECTSFFGLYKPDFSRRVFYAFSGFSYFINFFGLPQNASLSEVEAKGREICPLSWDDLQLRYPTANKYYLRAYCWLSVYTVALLHEGFGFPMEESRLLWTSKIDDQDVTYALGAMLYEVNNLPWRIGPNLMAKQEREERMWWQRAFYVTIAVLVAVTAWSLWREMNTRGGSGNREGEGTNNNRRGEEERDQSIIGINHGSSTLGQTHPRFRENDRLLGKDRTYGSMALA